MARKSSKNPNNKEYLLRYIWKYNGKDEIHYDQAIYINGWLANEIESRDVITHFCEITEP